jgi:transcription-repair coupling factor (superfamily II helicase)
MLVWQPERFGLAQLHQLRGRVGRGQRRAAAYLLVDPDRRLPPASEKRLRTLEALDRLGAGFAISARDLDLRGSGDLVGEDQAGHIKLIGLGLYQHLLALAVRAAQGEPADERHPEIRLGLSGRVPDSYVPEPELRLNLYTRVARLRTSEEADALRDEIEDRFGPLPQEVEALLMLARLRAACGELGIRRLNGGPQGLAADIDPGRADDLQPAMEGVTRRGERLLLACGGVDPADLGRLAARFLRSLQPG